MDESIAIMRTDLTASDLRSAACRSEEVAQARRLLAIALVLEGVSRSQAAAQTGMDRQTLRDWAHRYNEAGIEGLRSRRSPGRAPSLTAPQKAELKALVTQGADPKRDGVVRRQQRAQLGLIPIPVAQYRLAQSRIPIEMMCHG